MFCVMHLPNLRIDYFTEVIFAEVGLYEIGSWGEVRKEMEGRCFERS